jgi:lipoprotein-anchoring transpeptidase ErfK/SrfK
MTGGTMPAGTVAVRDPAVVLVLGLTVGLLACRLTEPSETAADAPDAATSGPATRLPPEYVLVGRGGATLWTQPPRDGVAATTTTTLGAGFGFAVTQHRQVGARRYVRLGDAGWVAAEQVNPARPSTFSGATIPRGKPLNVGWVITPQAIVRAGPNDSGRAIAARPYHSRITPAGSCGAGWCPLGAGWMRQSDLAVATVATRPPHLGADDRWLDIDLTSQILVAYQGDRPVRATLVSTGIGQVGSPLETPTGAFTIRSKRELVRMDNLEHTEVTPYSYDVPLAQYFSDGKALHAALWHDRFGTPTSHGCVNLAPADAEWLYEFTEAQVGTAHPGTLVRIRGQKPAVAAR